MKEKKYMVTINIVPIMDIIKTKYINDEMLIILLFNLLEDLELPIELHLDKYLDLKDKINLSIYYSSNFFLSTVYKSNIQALASFDNRVHNIMSDIVSKIINTDKKEVITMEKINIKKTEIILKLKAK